MLFEKESTRKWSNRLLLIAYSDLTTTPYKVTKLHSYPLWRKSRIPRLSNFKSNKENERNQKGNASVNSSFVQHPPGLLRGICPPRQSHGWGICKFCAARRPGICQPRDQFLSFWHARGFLSENNYTEDFIGKESRLAHLSRTGKIEEVCKGMFLILCMHFFIAYRARIT